MPTDAEVPVMPGEISLSIKQDSEGQVHSSVPLSWRPSPDLKERLQQLEVEQAFMLIVITNEGYEVTRQVVPLMDLMTYVQFRRPGKNRIHATVVYGKDPKRVLRKRHDNGVYACPVIERRDSMLDSYCDEWGSIDWDEVIERLGKEPSLPVRDALRRESRARKEPRITFRFSSINRLPEEGSLDVVVPKEMFAKEPSKALQWIVNQLPWEQKPHDQCHFRQRAMVSVPLLVPWLLIKLAVALPVVSVPAGVIGILALLGVLDEVVAFVIEILPTVGIIVGVLAIGSGLLWLVDKLFTDRIGKWWDRQRYEWNANRKTSAQAAKKANLEAFRQELELLSCTDRPQPTKLSDLPKERRTVRLRFLDLKSKVCKPFAS